MSAGNWFRLIMVLAGGLIFWMTLTSLAKRKFTDGFCMLWGVLSICMILGGILLSPVELGSFISNTGLLILLISFFGLLAMAWCFSWELSSLQRKNHELAMQVSLLNQEHDQIQRMLEEMNRKSVDEAFADSEKETSINRTVGIEVG